MRWMSSGLTVLALLLPAAADAAVCKYLPPPEKLSRAERILRETIETRERFGFPHGRDYVRRVNADPANRRRMQEGMFPMTARELAYTVARDSLTESRRYRRLWAYMRRHRDEFGDVSIEDDFPRAAYLQLRVTRRLAAHRRAVRRFGIPFRIKLVRYTERELDRIQDAIDFDALEAIGIHPISAGSGAEDWVDLEVATERTDAEEVVLRMYGPAVRVHVVGPTPTYLDCTRPESYEVSADGRTLTVHFGESGSITPRHLEVVETDYGVDVGVVVETPYFTHADLKHYSLTVTLAEPLGDRPLRSILYGYRVKRGRPGRSG